MLYCDKNEQSTKRIVDTLMMYIGTIFITCAVGAYFNIVNIDFNMNYTLFYSSE